INSIMYDNFPQQIALFSEESISPTYVTISYSNILGGESGIWVNSYMCEIYWLEGNIDSDPFFVNPEERDFHLQDTSPCIGAGIDEIEINGNWYYAPLFDIEGNPRPDPSGSMPDMGAYENPLGEPQVGITLNQLPSTDYHLTNYPNPFNPETTISFNLTAEDTEDVEILIYNLKGQKIRQFSIFNNQSSIIWDGTDENNQPVSSGIYFYKLKTDKFSRTRKMILLK
ncbi:MAG: T9SS type A sorting domain-containing protein, partial [Candidatus Cloacimonetes bacterium]|nr:T9SS type A sorting domain-containing protein [Candidatus Cloacimonadota bacterium]